KNTPGVLHCALKIHRTSTQLAGSFEDRSYALARTCDSFVTAPGASNIVPQRTGRGRPAGLLRHRQPMTTKRGPMRTVGAFGFARKAAGRSRVVTRIPCCGIRQEERRALYGSLKYSLGPSTSPSRHGSSTFSFQRRARAITCDQCLRPLFADWPLS